MLIAGRRLGGREANLTRKSGLLVDHKKRNIQKLICGLLAADFIKDWFPRAARRHIGPLSRLPVEQSFSVAGMPRQNRDYRALGIKVGDFARHVSVPQVISYSADRHDRSRIAYRAIRATGDDSSRSDAIWRYRHNNAEAKSPAASMPCHAHGDNA
jgi:hypothetical protein